jgi:hypothetical protein
MQEQNLKALGEGRICKQTHKVWDLANLKALGQGRICKQTYKGSCKPQSTWRRKNLQEKPQRILQSSKDLPRE